MNGLPYYKAYPRDFFEGTVSMPFELKCAYRLVIDLIYMHGGSLPDEPRFIAGHLGCSVRAWSGYRAKLIDLGKISCHLGIISNLRANYELDNLGIFQDKQRINASRPKKINALASEVAKPKPSHTDTDTDTVDKSTGASAPIDPVKVAFDNGRKLLVAAGVSTSQAGSMVGKWRKDLRDDAALIEMIGRATREGAVNPIEFIQGMIRARSKPKTPEPGDYRQNPSTGRRQVYMNHFDGWVNEG